MEEQTVPKEISEAPQRQPKNAPADVADQNQDGFARFLKKHSSPTHQRVTAGGRIVPMNPKPAPPEFKLIIADLENLTEEIRQNTARINAHTAQLSASRKQIEISSAPEPAILDSAKSVNNTAPPASVTAAPNQNVAETTNPSEQRAESGRRRGTRGKNGRSRPADLALERSNFTRSHNNFPGAVDLGPHQLPAPLSVGNASFALPGDAYSNATQDGFIAAGNNYSPLPILNRPSVPAGNGFDTQHPGAQTFHSAMSASMVQERLNNLQMHMTFNGSGQFVHSAIPVGNSMMSVGETTMSASRLISGSEGASSASQVAPQMGTIPISDDMVRQAQKEFNELDTKMRGQDGYTAQFVFNPQLAAYYGRERAKIAEQRDWARRRLNMLRDLQERKKAAEREAEKQQSRASVAPLTYPASTPKQGGTYFNAQAAAWVPTGSAHHGIIPGDRANAGGGQNAVGTNTSGLQADMVPDMGVIPISADFNYGYGNPSIDRISYVCPGVRVVKDDEGQASIDFAVPFTPGPYWRNSCGGPGPSESEVDEWGARRGNPPSTLKRVQQCQDMFMRELERQKEQGGSIDQAIINLRQIMNAKSSSSTPNKAAAWQESPTSGGNLPSIILNDGNAAPSVDSPRSQRKVSNKAPIYSTNMSHFGTANASAGGNNGPWPVNPNDPSGAYGQQKTAQGDLYSGQGTPFMLDAKEVDRRREVIERIHAACKPPLEKILDDSTNVVLPGLKTAENSSGTQKVDTGAAARGKGDNRSTYEADTSKATDPFNAPKVQKAAKTRAKTSITPWNFTLDSAQISNKTTSSVSVQSITADRLVPTHPSVAFVDGGIDRLRAVETSLTQSGGRRQNKTESSSVSPMNVATSATSQADSPLLRSVAELNTPSVQNAHLA